MAITLADVLDAMERDTTAKAKGSLVDVMTGATCAIGGAARALNVMPGALWWALKDMPECPTLPDPPATDPQDTLRPSLGRQIAHNNDYTNLSKAEVAALVRASACDLTAVVPLATHTATRLRA